MIINIEITPNFSHKKLNPLNLSDTAQSVKNELKFKQKYAK